MIGTIVRIVKPLNEKRMHTVGLLARVIYSDNDGNILLKTLGGNMFVKSHVNNVEKY